jgi:hypothetical protein
MNEESTITFQEAATSATCLPAVSYVISVMILVMLVKISGATSVASGRQ